MADIQKLQRLTINKPCGAQEGESLKRRVCWSPAVEEQHEKQLVSKPALLRREDSTTDTSMCSTPSPIPTRRRSWKQRSLVRRRRESVKQRRKCVVPRGWVFILTSLLQVTVGLYIGGMQAVRHTDLPVNDILTGVVTIVTALLNIASYLHDFGCALAFFQVFLSSLTAVLVMISALITCPFLAYEPSLEGTHYDLHALCAQRKHLHPSAEQCVQEKVANASVVFGLLLFDLLLVIVTSSIMCKYICDDGDEDMRKESLEESTMTTGEEID